MEFGNVLRSIFTSPGSEDAPLALVDSAAIRSSNGGRGPVSLAVLKRLAEFGRKERIPLIVIIEGKPLREVEDGGTYKDVTVYYASDRNDVVSRIAALIRKGRRPAQTTVVTGDPDVEHRALSLGASSMRGTTLTKAMESSLGGSRTSSRRGNRGGKSGRGPRRENEKSNSERNRKPKPKPPTDSDEDRILSLIDPL